MVEQMVEKGLLERREPHGVQFGITAKFREYAQARIVEPLPRGRALMLLTHKGVRAVADFQGQKVRTQGGAPIQVEPFKKLVKTNYSI
jgi:hypothetical protein